MNNFLKNLYQSQIVSKEVMKRDLKKWSLVNVQ
jgi:hypothetical protein